MHPGDLAKHLLRPRHVQHAATRIESGDLRFGIDRPHRVRRDARAATEIENPTLRRCIQTRCTQTQMPVVAGVHSSEHVVGRGHIIEVTRNVFFEHANTLSRITLCINLSHQEYVSHAPVKLGRHRVRRLLRALRDPHIRKLLRSIVAIGRHAQRRHSTLGSITRILGHERQRGCDRRCIRERERGVPAA